MDRKKVLLWFPAEVDEAVEAMVAVHRKGGPRIKATVVAAAILIASQRPEHEISKAISDISDAIRADSVGNLFKPRKSEGRRAS